MAQNRGARDQVPLAASPPQLATRPPVKVPHDGFLPAQI